MTQYQFVAWPDFGLPATAASMLEVIAAMHKTNALTKTPDSGESPVIVHCSAGVGRTGTLMATDICCQALDSFNKVRETDRQGERRGGGGGGGGRERELSFWCIAQPLT